MSSTYYEIGCNSMLNEVEMWFIANCSPDKYDWIEQYREDMEALIDCDNDDCVNECIRYLTTVCGYSADFVNRNKDALIAYLSGCAEISMQENLL